jgi:hypothetical protein
MGRDNKCDKGQKEEPLENWPLVDIKQHNANFFAIVRHLNATSLDPKCELENEHVTEECIALFVGNKVNLKSPYLSLFNRATMEDIY